MPRAELTAITALYRYSGRAEPVCGRQDPKSFVKKINPGTEVWLFELFVKMQPQDGDGEHPHIHQIRVRVAMAAHQPLVLAAQPGS
jgi:hypothetical protein